MCRLCRLDVRAAPLKVLATWRDERLACPRLKDAVERELDERMRALDIDDPSDEQL